MDNSSYLNSLLQRLSHLVGLRRDAKLWANTNDTGRWLIKRSLRTAMVDAEREGLAAEVAKIITVAEAIRP